MTPGLQPPAAPQGWCQTVQAGTNRGRGDRKGGVPVSAALQGVGEIHES